MNLRYCLYDAGISGEVRHAQTVMRELGIGYQKAVPQSLGDQWWFLDCKGIPDKLPVFLSEMKEE